MPSTMNISFSPTNGGIGSVDLPSGVFSQVEDLTKGDYKITTYHYKRFKSDQANPYVLTLLRTQYVLCEVIGLQVQFERETWWFPPLFCIRSLLYGYFS